MLTVVATSFQDIHEETEGCDITLPIEQTETWARYQDTIDGRRFWNALMIMDGGGNAPVAMLSLIEYRTHGYRYLRSTHGPVWTVLPNPALERSVVNALVEYVHHEDPEVVFLRIDTWTTAGTKPVLSTVPYDRTVIVDLTGGDDQILARMKKRGRRDVRKALRESRAVCRDETTEALTDFKDYYDAMVETAQRDGFAPAPMSDYTDMLKALGPDHCRLFAARIDGRVVAWAIVTINHDHAVYYYACSRTEIQKDLVPDQLLYFFCCALGQYGCTQIDLMGIGSDFAPSLRSLNTFKTKFSEDVEPVAPARDVPIRRGFYAALTALQHMRRLLNR